MGRNEHGVSIAVMVDIPSERKQRHLPDRLIRLIGAIGALDES
jgi:hypothetical protein